MGGRIALRLIGTTDVHANIWSYDYYRDAPDVTVGLARAATLIAAARTEAANSLVLDNGDFLQGTPLGDYAAELLGKDPSAVHPMIAAMNHIGYDAAALGNHEFNYGLDVLDATLKDAAFPFLACNVFRPDGSPRFTPWVVLEREFLDDSGAQRSLKIGVIGFTPPQIVQWDQSELVGRASSQGIAETARRVLPELRRAGADIVVALCHSGISRSTPAPNEENAATALAEVGGIDALFAGHQHLLLPGDDFRGAPDVDAVLGKLAGVPACMPGFWGGHIGLIDLALVERETGWRVESARTETRSIYLRDGADLRSLADEDRTLVELTRSAHEATLAYVRAPVGELAAPIHSYFALISDDASVEIVNTAQRWYVERMAPHTPSLQRLPILSASAPFKCGGRGGPDYYSVVEAGAVAIKNVADLYVYPNGLRVVGVTGLQVREWLERSASLFRRIDGDVREPQTLIDRDAVSYDFDAFDGVTYEIDVTQPARYDDRGNVIAPQARRIVDLRYRGAPIDERAEFLVITNSYRASGGGSFPGCDGSTLVFEAPDNNRDILRRYIAETGHVDPRRQPNWRFAPWPAQLVVTFPTAPAAANEPPPSGLRLTPQGMGEGGFLEMRIELTA